MQEGGDLLALGLPAWQTPLFQVKGQWMSRESYEAAIAAQRAQHIVEDFDHADLTRWPRTWVSRTAQAEYELADTGHGKALHVKIGHLGGWETLRLPCPDAAVSAGPHADLLPRQGRAADAPACAGMEGRGRLALDCDGGPDHGVEGLHAAAGPVQGRGRRSAAGGQQRQFDPQKAVSCCVGLALSHTALEGDKHEYWFDDLGTAPNPFGDAGAACGAANPGAGVRLAELPVLPDHDAGGGAG